MDTYEYMSKADKRRRPRAWWLDRDEDVDQTHDQQMRLHAVLYELPLARQLEDD